MTLYVAENVPSSSQPLLFILLFLSGMFQNGEVFGLSECLPMAHFPFEIGRMKSFSFRFDMQSRFVRTCRSFVFSRLSRISLPVASGLNAGDSQAFEMAEWHFVKMTFPAFLKNFDILSFLLLIFVKQVIAEFNETKL